MWSITIGNGSNNFYSKLHPAYSNSIVYAADRSGIIKAVNINNGKEIWFINLAKRKSWFSPHISEALSGGITVCGNCLYVGSEKAKVYAIDVRNGSVVWKTIVAGEILSTPVVSDGAVLVHTSNGYLQALNETDGMIRWSVDLNRSVLSLRGESTPSIVFDATIVGSDNGYVTAVSIKQGQIIWRKNISQITGLNKVHLLNDVDTTPIVINDIIYVSSYDDNLIAMNLHNGQIIWKRTIGSANDFVINNDQIYLIDQDDRLLSIKTKDGITLWTQNKLLHRFLTAPVFYNGNMIVVGDNKGCIYWIDSKNGSLLIQKKIDNSGFFSSPVIADNNKILIQSKGGILYAINANLYRMKLYK